MKTLLNFLIFTTLCFYLSSCKKPKDGEPGPQGPAGNANVHTAILTPLNWVASYDDGINFEYSCTNTCSVITQSVQYTGAVLAYFDDGDGGGWVAMPASFSTQSMAFNFNFSTPSPGNISLYLNGYDNSGSPGNSSVLNGAYAIKIIAIDGSRWAEFPKDIVNNYQAVKQYLQLAD